MLIFIITGSYMLVELVVVTTEEEIEKALSTSMEETKKEKKLLEQFLTKTSQELHNNGYQIGLSFSYLDRNLNVQVQDQEILEGNRKNIEKVINDIAKEIELQDFEINYLTLDSYPKISPEDEKLRDSIMQTYEEISNLLREKGYHHYSITLHSNKEVIIEIQGTKEELENSKGSKEIKELEKIIAQTILKGDMDVEITSKSESAIRDQEWQPIFDAIRDETDKKFEEYRGFAYSFHPEPLQIIIKTKIQTPKWFWNSDKKVNQITEYVDKIIELKREELSIEEIPYELIIRDINDKKIN